MNAELYAAAGSSSISVRILSWQDVKKKTRGLFTEPSCIHGLYRDAWGYIGVRSSTNFLGGVPVTKDCSRLSLHLGSPWPGCKNHQMGFLQNLILAALLHLQILCLRRCSSEGHVRFGKQHNDDAN